MSLLKIIYFTKEPLLLFTYFSYKAASCRKSFTEPITNPCCLLIPALNVIKESVSSLCILVTTSWASSQWNKFSYLFQTLWLCTGLVQFQQMNEIDKSREKEATKHPSFIVMQNWHKSSVGSQLGDKAKQEVQTLKSKNSEHHTCMSYY